MSNTSQTSKLESMVKKVIFSEEEIQSKIEKVAHEINHDFIDKQDDGIILLCILKGASVFMIDLAKKIDLKFQMDFLTVSSYGDNFATSGKCIIGQDLTCNVKGKHIIIAEDVIDSGNTLHFVIENLKERGAKSVCVCSLLNKHISKYDINVKYECFNCPEVFVVGYGLDYRQYFRNVPYIFEVNDKFIKDN